MIPIYLVAFVGICAVLDRAIKFFEYGYKYNPIKPLSNYSYLENMDYRDNLIDTFVGDAISKQIPIIEIGGHSKSFQYYANYHSYKTPDKGYYIDRPSFILIKGLAYEGAFDELLESLKSSSCLGFVIEGSLAGDSKRQLEWIMDLPGVIRIPYQVNCNYAAPEHCGGDISNRIVLVKPIN
jgi:hypothetical protein